MESDGTSPEPFAIPGIAIEATRPAGANILQQQAKFDAFIEEFNHQRPHEALEMKSPAQVYIASPRLYQDIPEPHYPFHDRTVMVTSCGRLCLYRKKINLSKSLAGQAVGVKEVDHGIWLVSFMDYDLGYIDLEEKTLQPLDNPFGPRVLPMCPVRTDTGAEEGSRTPDLRFTKPLLYQLSYFGALFIVAELFRLPVSNSVSSGPSSYFCYFVSSLLQLPNHH